MCNSRHFAVSLFFFTIFYSPLLQESLEERVQELEQALLAERIAAQRDRATITKLQRQINKVGCRAKIFSNRSIYICESEKMRIKMKDSAITPLHKY